MRPNELSADYFRWMYKLVFNKGYARHPSYRKLLHLLNETEFVYTIPMDANRAEDGTDLRYRFGYENSYDKDVIEKYLDNHSCSVLEMMISLAFRCEESIMVDPIAGNRTGQWFWTMIESLGLAFMNDENFDKRYSEIIISKFLRHEYNPNGRGGLFTVNNARQDLRRVEIWYQMCWYLDEVLGKEGV